MGIQREAAKKKPAANKGRGTKSTAGARLMVGSKTKAFLEKVASKVSRAGSLVKGKAPAAKKKAKKSTATPDAKKKVNKAKKSPEKKVAKKAVGARGANKPARERKTLGRKQARSASTAGKRNAPSRRRARSTPARKAGAPSVLSTRLVLEALDPHQAVAYWEVHPRAVARAREQLGEARARAALRVYEVSGLVFDGRSFDGTNANASFDVAIDIARGTHYLSLPSPGSTLIAEVGLRSLEGRFKPLVRSNLVDLPRGAEAPLFDDSRQPVGGVPSPLWRRRWSVSIAPVGTPLAAEAALASSDEEPEIVGVADPVPMGGVVPAAAAVRRTHSTGQAMGQPSPSIGISSDFVSGISSVGFAGEAPSSPGGRSAGDRAHLEVQADIVIYGHARPETDLVIEGIPVHVRKDGTFELRFTLGSVPWGGDPPPS